MKTKAMGLWLAMGAVFLFSAALQAGTTVDDIITMETDGYETRRRGAPKYKLVEFPHKRHAEDFEISCGECHHDEMNTPLDLKPGDSVQSCGECHNIFRRDRDNRRDIMVHENAMHQSCVECHREINREAGDPRGNRGPAPATCGKCHIRIE